MAAIDEDVLDRFRAAVAVEASSGSIEGIAASIGEGLSRLIGTNPALRAYIRRSFLEGRMAGRRILGELIAMAERGLRHLVATGGVDQRTLHWVACQTVLINLGATLLEPLLVGILEYEPFSEPAVRRRTEINAEFLLGGISAALSGRAPGTPGNVLPPREGGTSSFATR